MTTLLAVYDSDGCTGRCDAACYEATGSVCVCICQGANHGVGRAQAEHNTAALAESWLSEWQAAHPETVRVECGGQLPLPLDEKQEVVDGDLS